jgi:hypothetical protein
MDIKKLEGSLSFDDWEEGLVSYGNCKSFGDVWEKCVTCNYCDHKAACVALQDEYYNITCAQVIDLLLGQKTLEQIRREVEKNDRW